MRKKLALTLVTAAIAATFSAAAPAYAGHTLCDNEQSDNWFPIGDEGLGAGFEFTGEELFLCADHGLSDGTVLLVIRPDGSQTVCVFYTFNNNPDDDVCRVIL